MSKLLVCKVILKKVSIFGVKFIAVHLITWGTKGLTKLFCYHDEVVLLKKSQLRPLIQFVAES